MTHNYERSSWYKDGGLALASGILYGGTNALVGHPMDTVKSKMQAQAGFIEGGNNTMAGVIKRVWRTEGVVGFFRGVIPPFCGSSVYRSTQFAVFEAVYTRMKGTGLDTATIPHTGGLAWGTVVAGVCGASSRAVIESPIEYAKVKRQTGQTWQVREAYQGFSMQLPRTTGIMTVIFCSVDSVRRWSDGKALSNPTGQFLTWGGCSAFGFWINWPLETLKNQLQAGTTIEGIAGKPTLRQRVDALGGPLGLYRGIVPGTISVFLRNGAAAVVMGYANKQIAAWGLR
eukprot:TRINITY_DN62997_c0_g1_i1.p1 TRINITY_DN62997_c0_g1~~TRINITY_DN62997_c0_g1_i1.p1  ORF type:complete len:303 (-),score=44.34 TRINITY_DN62997_c0_g1_i1:73-930(-)